MSDSAEYESGLFQKMIQNGGKVIVLLYCIMTPIVALLQGFSTANEFLTTGFVALGGWWIVENLDVFTEWVIDYV